MTTKYKIVAGFVIMIILIGTVAFFGYLNLEKSSDGFTLYRRNANINIAVSDMATALTRSAQAFADQVDYGDAASLKRMADSLERYEKLALTGKELTELPERVAALDRLIEGGRTVRGLQSSALSVVQDMAKQYQAVRASYHVMDEKLSVLAKAAVDLDNSGLLYSLEGIRQGFAHCLSALARLSESNSDEDAEAAKQRIAGLEQPIQQLESRLLSEAGRRIFAELTAAYGEVLKAAEAMDKLAENYRTQYDTMLDTMRKLIAELDSLNGTVDARMRELGAQTLASNDSGQQTMIYTTLFGLLIGVALAAFILFGIIRVLNDVSGFAEATARGDLNYRVRTREKGEFGRMIASMASIPATLRSIVADYGSLEKDIENGQLLAQADAGKFQGAFADLISGTNRIISRFRMVLDNIPSPVIMLDRQLTATYLNGKAMELSGSDYQGKTCFQLVAREDFEGKDCALTKAVRSKQPASGETRAHPQGRDMDIAYTAIPMLNEKGELASVLQLITDLTELKAQQRTILQVANQAAEIAGRVAAASEQLSAQVEQVSKGAELQRDRIGSTASAMTEMNSTVLEVARSAGEASEQSEMTRQKAHGGAGLVNQVVQSITLVEKVAGTMQNNMHELGTQAENIGGVMNVISDIADQTNLLALNAAIEAARAGEAGRGFAVVADEVRKLAEKTMNATQEVGSSIRAIQQSAKVNIEQMGGAVDAVTSATGLAQSSGEALAEIVSLASSNSSVVASIATAAEQQSATSEEINQAIEEINHVVADTAGGMLQSSAAVQELSLMAQELRQVMDGLR